MENIASKWMAQLCPPLCPTLANVFLRHFEEKWVFDCSIDYKPISYERYIDKTFLQFLSKLQVKKFLITRIPNIEIYCLQSNLRKTIHSHFFM